MIPNPLVYDIFGAANWDNDNSNNDHYSPLRQDYQLDLPFYLNGTEGDISNGVYLNIQREKTYRYPIRGFGRYVQIIITSTSGTCCVRNISVNDTEGQRQTRAA